MKTNCQIRKNWRAKFVILNWVLHLNMKNNNRTGLDGFTVQFFFNFFWGGGADMGHIVSKSLNYKYQNGSLRITQKQDVNTCIPTQNKTLSPIYFTTECNIKTCISSYITDKRRV